MIAEIDVEHGHQSQHLPVEFPKADVKNVKTKNRLRVIASTSLVVALMIALTILISLMTNSRHGSKSATSSKEPALEAAALQIEEGAVVTDVVEKETESPSTIISSNPSYIPSISPTSSPSASPSLEPTQSPFFFGDVSVRNNALGIRMSAGISVRHIATSKRPVQFSNGERSALNYHTMSDGASIIALENGSYAYVANSEESDGNGGVYALYFDADGNVYDYKQLLRGTSRNCSGGLTPWKTYVSCEEYGRGQCFQIDPNPSSEHFDKAEATLLGARDGGRYESVAVDDRKKDKPVFFVTEDHEWGAMRRFDANGEGWDALHREPRGASYLNIGGDGTFRWTTNRYAAMESANKYYRNSEGVSFHEGKLYFMAKKERKMFILDLDQLTYEVEISGKKFYGGGAFSDQPDQVIVGPSRNFLYFTEDGGSSPGVYVRFSDDETYSTMFQGIPGRYNDDETVGIALSPDNMRFYAGIQDAGLILEFTRDDGRPFL